MLYIAPTLFPSLSTCICHSYCCCLHWMYECAAFLVSILKRSRSASCTRFGYLNQSKLIRIWIWLLFCQFSSCSCHLCLFVPFKSLYGFLGPSWPSLYSLFVLFCESNQSNFLKIMPTFYCRHNLICQLMTQNIQTYSYYYYSCSPATSGAF